MTFIEEIRQMKKEMTANKQEVEEEILDYFSDILQGYHYAENRRSFQENLKERFTKAYRDGKDEVVLEVEWWPGACGCSHTNFSITCCGAWYPNKDESVVYSYKDVDLLAISEEVVYDLKEMLLTRLHELGFDSRADYDEGKYSKKYVVRVRA